jgi:uncharacterized protein YgbK (DUF1537 family)
MDRSWFILADDLTGAADSAIAFARRGVPPSLLFNSMGFQPNFSSASAAGIFTPPW